MNKLRFPHGFLWGAATSAHQIEGNNENSDWWAWERSLSRTESLQAAGKDPAAYMSGIACDSYRRFDEDFALARHLGHNATRLGIEWARIEPREGFFDEVELDHYEQVLQSAKSHGLSTFVTLHHFTSPRWFMGRGGFADAKNIDLFLRFAAKAAQRLDQYVDFWTTINEPEIYATHGYLLGKFPPQRKSLLQTYRVINNLIAAHNAASVEIKNYSMKPVGMAYHLSDIQPVSIFSQPLTQAAHYLSNEYILRQTIQACDYIGVNYYNHMHIGWMGRRKHSHSSHDMTDMGWGIHPEGLERVLVNLIKHHKPIYITENGLADEKDGRREKFIKDHLYYTHRAIGRGADVRGYLHWSLLDNFEWAHGFWPRFGLIGIDREDNLRRKVRFSATKYAEICNSNELLY